MRTRSLPALLAALLLVTLVPGTAGSATATAVLPQTPAPLARDLLPGDLVPADRNLDQPLRAAAAPAAELFAEPSGQTDCGYAQYPEDPDDAAIKLGLIPYHEIAPKLCELEQASDRVSVEVIGQSTLGRDLHLVTVTLPETPEEAARQDAYSDLVVDDPQGAIAQIDELAAEYKTPMFVNNNIHGNEWEGTDASLEVIEDLALTDDPDELALLADARLYFVATMNPDGRVAGTRANGAGFDMNRDFITQSQPETRAVRDAITTTTPLIMLDIHGYTTTTLVEPCTKPHNNNYEYDLYIKWALPQAEAMESAITQQTALAAAPVALAAGVEIPYRDREEGWDDWPPIFTPMYAMHQGAIGHTIEVPIPVNTLYSSPASVLQEFSRQNTVVARAAIEGAFAFAHANRADMLRDQLEVFRRGMAGEDSPGNDGDGNAVWRPQTFPEAYVIPSGGAASPTAVARLVNMLLDNGIEVQRTTDELVADGTAYAAGSYLVDMRQARRGLANVMLEAGTDISADVASMYDISGWSLGLLWGASVVAVEQFEATNLEPFTGPAVSGGLADFGEQMAAYWMSFEDLSSARALDALWDADIDLRRSDDGRVWIAGQSRDVLGAIAADTGVWFVGADGLPAEARALPRLRVAAAVTGQERFALDEMGVDVTPVTTSALNGAFSLDGYDVLLVASGLSYSSLTEDGQAEVRDFLARGGGVVGRGSTGATFNDQAGLLDVARQSGPGGANGVVAVSNAPDSPVTGSSASADQRHSFVYAPLWFTELGDGVRADQRLADGNPLVAGHWLGSADTAPESAGGHALVVSGTAENARVVLFGSEPLFRAHPKGLYLQVAEALLWAAGH